MIIYVIRWNTWLEQNDIGVQQRLIAICTNVLVFAPGQFEADSKNSTFRQDFGSQEKIVAKRERFERAIFSGQSFDSLTYRLAKASIELPS